jgi:hypothetical protein
MPLLNQEQVARMAQALLIQQQQRMLHEFISRQQQQQLNNNAATLTPLQLSLLLQQRQQQQQSAHCSICAINFDSQASYNLHCSLAHSNEVTTNLENYESAATSSCASRLVKRGMIIS